MRDPFAWGVAIALAIRFPIVLVLPLVDRLLARWLEQRRLHTQRLQAKSDVSTLGRILLVGLAAGLALPVAMEIAAREIGPVVAGEVSAILRAAKRDGISPSLAVSSGPHTRPLFSRLALAQASGAPMLDGVAAFLSEVRSMRRAEAIERARRLPVTLMIPLGLLILPGFVVLFVGPILLMSIGQLVESLQ
jgi:tight adherence protein B